LSRNCITFFPARASSAQREPVFGFCSRPLSIWFSNRWCEQKQIQLTRGRPYKKDDNAHVEQKNWTHVRKLLGWERYDSEAAVEAINDLNRHELRLWMNLYLPSVKLGEKSSCGIESATHL